MKIKLLKDIPGYKAGHIFETSEGSLGMHTFGYRNEKQRELCHYHYEYLLEDGWAEEIKDDIDIEEIRKSYKLWSQYPYSMAELSKEEQIFLTAYRIVKAVIEKLNGDWKPNWSESNGIIHLFYNHRHNELGWGLTYSIDYSPSFLLKNVEIAQKVISLCESELYILFGVK